MPSRADRTYEREDAGDAEANLSFIFRGHKLEIVGANTGYYHGARAYFDGDYVETNSLSAKTQAKVVKSAKADEVREE